MDPDLASAPVGASLPRSPLAPSSCDFDHERDARSSLDHPPLETCKRELEAVLASLDRAAS